MKALSLITLALGILWTPLWSEAQQPTNVYRLGWLGFSSLYNPDLEAIRQISASWGTSRARTSPWNSDWRRERLTDSPTSQPSWLLSAREYHRNRKLRDALISLILLFIKERLGSSLWAINAFSASTGHLGSPF